MPGAETGGMGGRTGRNASRPELGGDFEGVSGAALLERLADQGRTDIMEAFWRYGDPQVCAALVGPVLRTGPPSLLRFIVDEVLEPTVPEPFPTHLMGELRQRRPALSEELTNRLAGRLRDPAPLPNPQLEGGRDVLEVWVIGQSWPVGARFAVAVLKGETPRGEAADVHRAACRRCLSNPELLTEGARAAVGRIEASRSPESWNRGAELVEIACQGNRIKREIVEALRPLVVELASSAPQLAQVEQFAPRLSKLIAGPLFGILGDTLASALPDTPGARALLRTIPAVIHPRRRARLFAVALAQQSHLWPTLEQLIQSWDEEDWARYLAAAASVGALPATVSAYLIQTAPGSVVSHTISFALAQSASEADPLLTVAGMRLSQRLQELEGGSSTTDALVKTVDWRHGCQQQNIHKLGAVFAGITAELIVQLLTAALGSHQMTARHAAILLPAGGELAALTMMRDRERRAALAAALCDARPDVGPFAVADIQEEGFSVEVARALAARWPGAAFSGSEQAWDELPDPARDELVDLLGRHATIQETAVIEAIIRDDHVGNAHRRAKAVRTMGALLSGTGDLPSCVAELLRSNIGELREAAVRAIARISSRDLEVIDLLHGVEQDGGDPGRAASEALEAVARKLIVELEAASTKDPVAELLPVLGATGRPMVLPYLLRYLGARAIYDDPNLHRIAASATARWAERSSAVSPDEQAQLVALLDGEEREADPSARADLSKALARVQLGEDETLQVLYDFIDFHPQADPAQLFKQEKDPLVRQLALYERERSRGQAGWGAALAHLDNAAERLVRAAYLECAEASDKIKAQIRSDPGRPDYGSLIGALGSVKELQAIRDDCGKLHDIRSKFTEVPHPGTPPDASAWTTAHHCFTEIGKTCVGVVSRRLQNEGG